MSRGILTGEIKRPEDIPEGDIRRHMPRYQGDAFFTNLELVNEVQKLAKQKGCTAAQLAISWVKQSGKGHPVIIPIPGATTEERVLENAKEVELKEDELAEIQSILNKFKVVGGRYPAAASAHLEA